MAQPPPPPEPIDPELLRELGELSDADHCRRLLLCRDEEHRLEVELGRARRRSRAVSRALAERLHRLRRFDPIVVDGTAFAANHDLRGCHLVRGGKAVGQRKGVAP